MKQKIGTSSRGRINTKNSQHGRTFRRIHRQETETGYLKRFADEDQQDRFLRYHPAEISDELIASVAIQRLYATLTTDRKKQFVMDKRPKLVEQSIPYQLMREAGLEDTWMS
jgi:hypothetical protein